MVNDGAEILALALRAKAKRHARRLIAQHLEPDLALKHADALNAGIDAGITGLVLAMEEAGMIPVQVVIRDA